jgi:glucose-6-phosphate 1-dehydrogenase
MNVTRRAAAGLSLPGHLTVPMDFSYGGSFKTQSAEAYERLLHDAMAGDQTLFLREDAVERSWAIVAPILDGSGSVRPYAAGTWGPTGLFAGFSLLWRPGLRRRNGTEITQSVR